MDYTLLEQLKQMNPWWENGPRGMDRYADPEFKRELFREIRSTIERTDQQTAQIVSIVGMRQVGKSTMMRQIIRDLLRRTNNPIDAERILYVSFDDQYLQTRLTHDDMFEKVIDAYVSGVLHEPLDALTRPLYFFFDEINALHDFEKIMKTYYDRHYNIRYCITGSSAVILRQGSRESLIGRRREFVLSPFSFHEYFKYHLTQGRKHDGLSGVLDSLQAVRIAFAQSHDLEKLYRNTEKAYTELSKNHKSLIREHLSSFVIDSGFPRAWTERESPLSKQKFLWEQHVEKVLFVDLFEAVKFRKPKELERLFAVLVEQNGSELTQPDLQRILGMKSVLTLEKYVGYLCDLSLIYRLDKTKTPRMGIKKRSGYVKYYLTDIALRHAFYKKDVRVFDDPNEIGKIAENLVCVALQNFLLLGTSMADSLAYYRNGNKEVDFILKTGAVVLPIEVKFRNDIPGLSALDELCAKWGLTQSMVITKDHDLAFNKGRLSIPLWFFLLIF